MEEALQIPEARLQPCAVTHCSARSQGPVRSLECPVDSPEARGSQGRNEAKHRLHQAEI